MSGDDLTSRARQYDRLLRRTVRFEPKLEYAKALKFAAQEILAENPIGSDSSPEEVKEMLCSLLPPPQTVFSQEFFCQPVFPVGLIRDVAKLYGCLDIDQNILDSLSAEKKADSLLMANVWLAHAYDPTLERVMMMVDMYETSRIFNPLTLAMPLDPVPFQPSSDEGNERPVFQHTAAVRGRAPTPVNESPAVDSRPVSQRDVADYGRSRRGTDPVVPPRNSGEPTKKPVAVEQYFRSSKHSGDLIQSLQNTIRDYNVCAMQLELTDRQKALLFINVFGGTAQDYFFEHCREEMTYEQLVNVMKKGFDNNARQLAIESELENLTLEKVMRDNDITDANEGLTKLADKINSLFPQMPIQSQYAKNKARFLRKSVLEQDWAKASIAQIVTSDFNFDHLLTSLREQYQLEREVKEAKNRSASIPGTLYQQYGRNPNRYHRGRRNSYPSRRPGQKRLNPIGKDGQRMRCSLCGLQEHFINDCPPGASRQFVRSSLAQGVPAVHLCHDLLNGIEALGQFESDPTDYDENASSPKATEDAQDNPSELHLFDQICSAEASKDLGEEEEQGTGILDKVDENIATNFISAKFAQSADVAGPQLLFHPDTTAPGFRQDV